MELLFSRAVATLALGHLLTSQAESLERQAHRTLISAIIERSGRGRRRSRGQGPGARRGGDGP